MKKAQVSTEALLIYGAVIVVILVGATVLVRTKVVDLSFLKPEKCQLSEPLSCNNYDTYDNAVLLEFGNSLGKDIKTLAVSVKDPNNNENNIKCDTYIYDKTLQDGATSDIIAVYCEKLPPPDSKIQAVIEVDYHVEDSTVIRNSKGSMSAMVTGSTYTYDPEPTADFTCIDDEDGGPPLPGEIEPCDDSTCWCADPNDLQNGYMCNCIGGTPQILAPQGTSGTPPQTQYVNPEPTGEFSCFDDEDGGPPEDPNNPEACDDSTCWCADPNDILNGYVCNCVGGSPQQFFQQGTSGTPPQNQYVNPEPTSEFTCIDDEDGGPPLPGEIEPCDDSTCWCADPNDLQNGYMCNCVGGSPQQLVQQGSNNPGSGYVNPEPTSEFTCIDDEDGGPPLPGEIEPCDDSTCWCADPNDLQNGYMCNCVGGSPQQFIPQGTTGPGSGFVNPEPTSEFTCIDDEDGGPPLPGEIEPCDDSTCWCADPNDVANGYMCNCAGGVPQSFIPQAQNPTVDPAYVNPEPNEGYTCIDDEDGGPPLPGEIEPCDDSTCWCADPNDVANGYMCNCAGGVPQQFLPQVYDPNAAEPPFIDPEPNEGLLCYDDEDCSPPEGRLAGCDDESCWCANPSNIQGGCVCQCSGGVWGPIAPGSECDKPIQYPKC